MADKEKKQPIKASPPRPTKEDIVKAFSPKK